MCPSTFLRLRRSLATSTLYAAVRILAERFCVIGTKFPITQELRILLIQHKRVNNLDNAILVIGICNKIG